MIPQLIRAQKKGLRSISQIRTLAALTDGPVGKRELPSLTGVHRANIDVQLAPLVRLGLVEVEGLRVRITRKGRRLIQPVISDNDLQ